MKKIGIFLFIMSFMEFGAYLWWINSRATEYIDVKDGYAGGIVAAFLITLIAGVVLIILENENESK